MTLVLPLVNQLQMLQQQMFDHCEQVLMSMAEMFSTMHRDQMAVFQKEMEHLRNVTGELEILRAELKKQTAAESQNGIGSAPSLRLESKSIVPSPAPCADEPQAPAANEGVPRSDPGNQAGDDVHAWLNQRIAVLQAQRRSGWQKILSRILDR